MGRSENVAIFEDTLRMCKSNPKLQDAIKRTNQYQEVILEGSNVPQPPAVYNKPAKVIVSKRRSFEAAQNYFQYDTCVLNFASATNPGGGVVWGSTAQEECLCRCSTLYSNLNEKSLWRQFYGAHRLQNNPLYNDDCIYSPEVVVFKSDTVAPTLLPEENWWWVDVITCAAPNLRNRHDDCTKVEIADDELKRIHIKRMRRILSIAAQKDNEVVILGAYGCGAFKNPPEVVAEAMKIVTQEFLYHFRVIEFAVYCSPRDDLNYRVFQRALGSINRNK